jgi:hypothetical protein
MKDEHIVKEAGNEERDAAGLPQGFALWLEELLYQHDPSCGGEDCRYTASRIAQPIADYFVALAAQGKDRNGGEG